ncbi:YbbR-like domain-containing protein [Evansella sp. AB-rgal1]|uniref:CdaR family protein n=1 Tax=Evansella sp. AB-rgal1 TaxID=3242696 RepID=UPI00359DA9A8
MDKWFHNTWFIKGISLLIAIMLYLVVNMESGTNQPGGLPITHGTKYLGEVELNVLYDEENYVITDVSSETVEVNLRGPQAILTSLSLERPVRYELFVDVRDMEPGEYYVEVQHRNFPSDISVNIQPRNVRVIIQERQTISVPVQIELVNEGDIEAGYTIGTPTSSPSNVDITAARGIIDQIAYVRASVDVAGRNATFQETARIVVLDRNGNELNLNTDPPAVDVTVPITSPNKEVPLRIGRGGELPSGIAIDSITPEPATVTIYGPVPVINEISFIDLEEINLDSITEDTTLEVEVPIPNGVERVEPEVVTITIDVTQEETRVFSDFVIDVTGVPEDYTYSFLSPEEGTLNLNVMGSPTVLGRLERSDLQLYVNLEGLSAGEHEVPLQFSGPQNVWMNTERATVQVLISDTESQESMSFNDESEVEEDEQEVEDTS